MYGLHLLWLLVAIFCAANLQLAHAEREVESERLWLNKVHAQIALSWERSFLADCDRLLPIDHSLNKDRTLRTILSFKVAPDGKISDVRMVVAAHPDLDRATQEVMQMLTSLPPPPFAALSDDGYAHLRWPFPRDPRRGGVPHAQLIRLRWPTDKAVEGLIKRGELNAALDRAQTDASGDLTLLDKIAVATIRRGIKSSKTRLAALEAAAQGRVRGIWSLIKPRLRDVDEAVHLAAIRAAGVSGDQAAIPSLTKAFALGGEAQRVAVLAMVELGSREQVWRLLEPLLDEPELNTLSLLEEVGARASIASLTMIAQGSHPAEVRASALRALAAAAQGQIGPVLKILRRALTAQEVGVRLGAVQGVLRVALDGVRSRGLFYRVIPLLKEKNIEIRAAAIQALALLGRERALAELLLISKKVKLPALKIASVLALGWIPKPEATKRLVKMLDSKAKGVEAAALLALAGRDDAEARQVVAEHSLKGLKLSERQSMKLAVARWRQARKTPEVTTAFVAAYHAALDRTERIRFCGAWLASR